MAPGVLDVAEKRELVERVANSPAFRRSPRLREFLLYVAECTISDRQEDARELQIALNIFHRKTDYNPGQDNIVRVEARSLRKRLEAYFATEGKDEPIVLVMPKGGYTIAFEPRPSEQRGLDAEAMTIAETGPAPQTRGWGASMRWGLAGAVVLLVATAGYFAISGRSQATASTRVLPFSALMDDTHDTYIVTSDASLVLMQELLERQISLDDYVARRFDLLKAPDAAKADLSRILQDRNYTNAAEMGVAAQIIQRKGAYGQRMFLRSSREMQFSDVKNQNVIFLGSSIGNPWVKLFSDKLNFHFDLDDSRRGLFRNRSPQPGEQAVYSMTTRSGESGEAYAVVAFLPNVNRNGHVLMISGTTSEGTQAGGEFIMNEARTAQALAAAGIDHSGPPGYFEILLRVKAVAGSATESAMIAHRSLSL